MPDLFGKKQLGRATTGGRFYATPTERVEAGAIYFPDESSLLFGVAEYTVEAGNLEAFATEGTFVFEKPSDWLDALGRKVFFRPSSGEIVNQDKKGDVLIGFQIFANVPDDKLGVVLTSGENSVVIIVTSTADSGAGSLRQAIANANDGDVILFDSDVFPVEQTTSILLSAQLVPFHNVGIYGGESDGNGGYTSGAIKQYYVYREIDGVKTKVVITSPDDAQEGETVLFTNVCRVALDGQGANRCVYNGGANINWLGVCFANGYSGNYGGAVNNYNATVNTFDDCAFTDSTASVYGGALYASNTTQNTLNACVIDGCNSGNGGGVYTTSSSQNTLNGCVIDGCSATNGGGVYSNQTSQNTLNDCTITDCSATSNGGGVYSAGTSQNTLNVCTITDCSATYGGGVYSTNTSQNTLTNCTITGCSATSGGGVYSTNTSQNTLTGCTIAQNTSIAANRKGFVLGESSTLNSNNNVISHLFVAATAILNITNNITAIAAATINAATITINDGAALTITGTATIGAATFTSEGRGYLAVAAGIDTSAATLTNVVVCTYGAGLESFAIDKDGANWTADDLTTPILLEEKGDGAVWTTLSDDATGGSYSDSFAIGTTLRAFDGVRFLVASLDAYWQVESFVVASNGGGGAGDVSPSWTISDATITPNAEEV